MSCFSIEHAILSARTATDIETNAVPCLDLVAPYAIYFLKDEGPRGPLQQVTPEGFTITKLRIYVPKQDFGCRGLSMKIAA